MKSRMYRALIRPTGDQVAMVMSFAAIFVLFVLLGYMFFTLRAGYDATEEMMRSMP